MKFLSPLILASVASASTEKLSTAPKYVSKPAPFKNLKPDSQTLERLHKDGLLQESNQIDFKVAGSHHFGKKRVKKIAKEAAIHPVPKKQIVRDAGFNSKGSKVDSKKFQKMQKSVQDGHKIKPLSERLKRRVHSKEFKEYHGRELVSEMNHDALTERELKSHIPDNYLTMSSYDTYDCSYNANERYSYLVNYCYGDKESKSSFFLKTNLNDNVLVELMFDNAYCGGIPTDVFDIFEKGTFSYNTCYYGLNFEYQTSFPNDDYFSDGIGVGYTDEGCDPHKFIAWDWTRYNTCFYNDIGTYMYVDEGYYCADYGYAYMFYYSDDYCMNFYGSSYAFDSFCISGSPETDDGFLSHYYATSKCFPADSSTDDITDDNDDFFNDDFATTDDFGDDATDDTTCAGTRVSFNFYDSYGDGWNGNYLYSSDTSIYATLHNGGSEIRTKCLPSGTYEIACCGGYYDTEVSWTITSLDGLTTYGSGTADDACSIQSTFTI